MTDIDSILDRIRAWVQSKHGRKAIITRHTGLNANTLTGIGNPDWNPSADTIRKIEGVMLNHDSPAEPATTQP